MARTGMEVMAVMGMAGMRGITTKIIIKTGDMGLIWKWVCNVHPDDPKHWHDDDGDGYCHVESGFHGYLEYRQVDPDKLSRTDVQLVAPEGRNMFSIREAVRIVAEASSAKGSVVRVDFLVNGRKVGDSNSAPYTCMWQAAQPGNYDLTAVATDNMGGSKTSAVVKVTIRPEIVREIGLSVLLMDASSSMTEPISDQESKTRMQQVAESAASGIFDLQRLQNSQNAWVKAFKFDDRVKPMFEDSVGGLIDRFGRDVKKFAAFIHDELYSMQQDTDINAALRTAYNYVDGFLQKKLDFPVRDYIPMNQTIMRGGSTSSITIPNIRVMMYTDGRQYDSQGNRTLKPNPFLHPPAGLNHDVLIGAFFGSATDEGCSDLKELVSFCPSHENVKQFFLFDSVKKMDHMKHLFRMASGASGFCPLCLGNQLKRDQNTRRP
jgi:hypothetical protein